MLNRKNRMLSVLLVILLVCGLIPGNLFFGETPIVHAEYPEVGFYASPEIGETYLQGAFEYDINRPEGREVYCLVNEDVPVENVRISMGGEIKEGQYEIETLERDKAYRISWNDDIFWGYMSVSVSYDYIAEEDVVENRGEYLEIFGIGQQPRIPYTDGAEHTGYAGCYMSEAEFKYRAVNWGSGEGIYYVHADTIQGVIDKLAAVSEGESVLYGVNNDGVLNGIDRENQVQGIENTGYVQINVSHYGNVELTDQYVSSSGNMKGIFFVSGADHYMTVPMEGTNHTLEDGLYYEDALYEVTEAGKAKYEMFASETYISLYRGNIYKVTEAGDSSYGTPYYSMGDKIEIEGSKRVEIIEELTKAMQENYDPGNGGTAYFLRYNTSSFVFPDIHVNIYSDMYFCGKYSNIWLGFKEGEYHTATFDLINEMRTYSYENRADDAVELYSHATSGTVHFYEISSSAQTDEESTYEGDNGEQVSMDVPEPNALRELPVSHRDRIEEGKHLTVSIKAEDMNNTKHHTDDMKRIVDEFDKRMKDKYGDRECKCAYLDLSVMASVAGEKEKVDITETIAPLKIRVPLPREFYHLDEVVIFRHHEKDGEEEIVTIACKVITEPSGEKYVEFESDKFSFYGLAAGEGNGAKVGEKVKVKGAVYKVTVSEAGDHQVSFVKAAKKAKSVTIPKTVKARDIIYQVTAIEKNALKGSQVKKVVISPNVKKIGAKAFADCKKLKNIVVKSKQLKSIGKQAFAGVSKKAVCKVPAGCNYKKQMEKAGYQGKLK